MEITEARRIRGRRGRKGNFAVQEGFTVDYLTD